MQRQAGLALGCGAIKQRTAIGSRYPGIAALQRRVGVKLRQDSLEPGQSLACPRGDPLEHRRVELQPRKPLACQACTRIEHRWP